MLYTRTGDDGTTSLFGGKRVSKSDPQIEALGSIDELNCFVGLIIYKIHNHVKRGWRPLTRKQLTIIQQDLYKIMSHISGAKIEIGFLKEKVKIFEKEIDIIQKKLPKLHKFILPQGTELSCWFHICRTICRRAERNVVACFKHETTKPWSNEVIIYLNRLSDLFFILARKYNKEKFVI